MKKSIFIVAFTLFLNSFLTAQSSFDYAYGLELNAQSGQIFSRVKIPDEVYLNTLSPLLKDAAVFNANDQAVAFSFVDVEKIENITQEIPVTLYFINEKTNNTTRGVVYTYTYRIKLLNEGNYVSYLELDWKSADYNWEAKADVEFGAYTAVRGVLLAELKDVSNENSLRADKIRVEDYDYDSDAEGWQLIITSDVKIPKITSVRAYANEQYTDRSLVELKAKYQENIDDALIYKLPSIQPVEGLFVDLGQRSLILPLNIFYKDGDKWIELERRVINEKADIKLQKSVFAKEFMLKINGGFANTPKLSIYRKRVDIVFNSANNAPFILAYGSYGAKSLDLPPSDFLKGVDIANIPAIYTGNIIKLGGEKTLQAKIEEENGIPKWAIWMTLVFGAAFLIFLAYRLSKEIKEN